MEPEIEVTEPVVEEMEETVVESEPWMSVEEPAEDDDPAKIVPLHKHMKVKSKLRGQISERDEEIERLRLENEKLKQPVADVDTLKRPQEDDFETDEEYQTALDEYHDARTIRVQQREQQAKQVEKQKEELENSVNDHYTRADALIQSAGIKPEIYQHADAKVRGAIESVLPNIGNNITDAFIHILGEGSEKVMYYLGRNEAALMKFQSLLAADKTGLKAAIYLGQEKQRLTSPIKPRSSAPSPAPNVQGDAQHGTAAASLKKKYDEAHKKGRSQDAYNVKKQARAAGIDTRKW